MKRARQNLLLPVSLSNDKAVLSYRKLRKMPMVLCWVIHFIFFFQINPLSFLESRTQLFFLKKKKNVTVSAASGQGLGSTGGTRIKGAVSSQLRFSTLQGDDCL